MRTLEYVCGVNGESIGFEGPVYGETMPALRGRQWSYTTGLRNLSAVSRPTREVDVTVKSTSLDELDRMRRLMDADMDNNMPGTLVADGEWTASAYVVKSDPQNITPRYVSTTLTIVLLEGVWRHEADTIQCVVQRDDSGDTWLDLPTDLPIDLQSVRRNVSVSNPLLYPIPWRMIVYGPTSNPRVDIAGNRYMVDTLIPDGGRLTVDCIDRTVTLTAVNGDTSNLLGKARRGTGLDSGEYIFQPIPSGVSVVEWDGSFGFDLTPIIEESEPPWST